MSPHRVCGGLSTLAKRCAPPLRRSRLRAITAHVDTMGYTRTLVGCESSCPLHHDAGRRVLRAP